MRGRLTNVALLCLLTGAFASGWVAFELTGQFAHATLVVHAAAGVSIVLLVPWKSLVANRGLRRPRRLRWTSLVLAAGVLVSLAFGFLHSFGRPEIGYLTAMEFHVGAALAIVPFFIWHVLARPAKLRSIDLSRRNFLKGAALLGASANRCRCGARCKACPDRFLQRRLRDPDPVDVRCHAPGGSRGLGFARRGKGVDLRRAVGLHRSGDCGSRLHGRLVLRAVMGGGVAGAVAAGRRHGQLKRERALGHRIQQAVLNRRRVPPVAGNSR